MLSGQCGTGKTHALLRAHRFCDMAAMHALDTNAYDHPMSSGLYHWPGLSDGFKNGAFGVMADLFDVDVLFLDDIGADYDPSKMATDKLCQILSRRERKHTFLTTNIKRREWAQLFDARLSDRFMRNEVSIDLGQTPSYASVII